MIVKTIQSFNRFTRDSLNEKVNGYINKTKSTDAAILELKSKYNLKTVYRFDLGENIDGFSPKINDFLENLNSDETLFNKLHKYPDFSYFDLSEKLSDVFKIPERNIIISSGLDSIIDLISRVFLGDKDFFLMPVPNFFLFESYSKRMGASPLFFQLKEENNFTWTTNTFDEFINTIVKYKPKLIWISNPNNPTGQVIPEEYVREIIKTAYYNKVNIVIDEAYHEYIGGPCDSAVKFLKKFTNLMVLRTFSKAFGLAGLRLGYLMCSDTKLTEALLLYRPHFPIAQLSLNIASIATMDMDFINTSRTKTEKRREILFNNLDTLSTFKYIPSDTCIFMLKNNLMSASDLDKRFKKCGIITSRLNITGITPDEFLRITVRTEDDNLYLFNVCKEIEREIL